jgi:hypothetical protein
MQMKTPRVDDAQRGSFARQSAQREFSARIIAACTRFFGSVVILEIQELNGLALAGPGDGYLGLQAEACSTNQRYAWQLQIPL